MVSDTDYKAACLARWRANAAKRRALALSVMDNRASINPKWPMWMQYDIRSEIGLIEPRRQADAAK